MTDELPQVVVDGIVPILKKYGIEKPEQHKAILIESGRIIGSVVTKINLANPKKGLKKMQDKLLGNLIQLLGKNGIEDPMSRQNCAQEILEFVYGLLKELKAEMET